MIICDLVFGYEVSNMTRLNSLHIFPGAEKFSGKKWGRKQAKKCKIQNKGKHTSID